MEQVLLETHKFGTETSMNMGENEENISKNYQSSTVPV